MGIYSGSLGKQGYLGAITVVFGGKYSSIWKNTVLLWANTVVFWANTVVFGGKYCGIGSKYSGIGNKYVARDD